MIRPCYWAAVWAATFSLFLYGPALSVTEAAEVPSGLLCNLLEHPEETVITTAMPDFGWIYNPSMPNDAQAGYRIIVASSEASAVHGTGDMWDSGVIHSSASINVPYAGTALQPNSDYFWCVQTVDSSGQPSPFSAVQHFRTDTQLTPRLNSVSSDPIGVGLSGVIYQSSSNIWANRYPLRFMSAAPVLVTNTAPGRWFIDFGQDAFGYATVHLNGAYDGTQVQARFGEMANGNAVDTAPPPGSLIRYTNVEFTLQNGDVVYPVRPPLYHIYNPKKTLNPPANYGLVTPFRYLELTNVPGTLSADDVVQERLLDEFNTNAATFNSSSPALNQIWNLCRNSMQVLTFDGVYVDGDRERTPYESDSYIHQLSSYAVDREFTLPRYSFEYLLQNPTWPTEWKFHMIFMAWADYLQTGDPDLLYRYYDALKPDLLAWNATGNGLIKGFPRFPMANSDSDVVDWPPGDRDGFVMSAGHYLNWTNAVNNAFYYRSLKMMADIADAVGQANDAANYRAMAEKVYSTYNDVFWNSHLHHYMDGVGTTHASAHANFFPLAFGLVPADRQEAVLKYLHSRINADNGMPPSVYGAQYFIEALFQSGDANTALDLMITNGPRSWLNMINIGSTITTEAWSFQDKGNEDWNHAWGAAPGNLIARYILGVRPLTPGYGQILIQPHLGTKLSYVQGTIPTIRGTISIEATNAPDSFQLSLNIPGNVTATVQLPSFGMTHPVVLVDNKEASITSSEGWLTVTNIGSGPHSISVDAKSKLL